VSAVCFSGDKLLGGPQAGLIVGKRDAIERIRRHPLARALRIDKASLAGLEATLRLYQRGEATTQVPIWKAIARSADELERRARDVARSLGSSRASALATRATVGGGSLPGETLASWAVAVGVAADGSGISVAALARRLRGLDRPVIGRIEQDRLVLDLRTVEPEDDPTLLAALRAILA